MRPVRKSASLPLLAQHWVLGIKAAELPWSIGRENKTVHELFAIEPRESSDGARTRALVCAALAPRSNKLGGGDGGTAARRQCQRHTRYLMLSMGECALVSLLALRRMFCVEAAQLTWPLGAAEEAIDEGLNKAAERDGVRRPLAARRAT